jgi:hypothetical protein
LSPAESLARAGQWFLYSGIQEPSGGVARFYRSEAQKNKPVSTEITGYAAKIFVFLYRTLRQPEYLDAAHRAADFLVSQAWDESLQLFPYEYPSPSAESKHRAYFFDSGIIIRGLIAVWEETRVDRLLDVAAAAARGMSAFRAGTDYHPILTLPDKASLPRMENWSTSPGCYQAKSALAWWELAAITGDADLKQLYLEVIESGLRNHHEFLVVNERLSVVDRLHAYCYFLEALPPRFDQPEVVAAYGNALAEIARVLRVLAPEFSRSDVYAQLLRARLRASHLIPVDVAAAREEATALAGFQAESTDKRIDGGYLFGKRGGELSPHVNPVSTAFAVQALEMWRAFEAGDSASCLQAPI